MMPRKITPDVKNFRFLSEVGTFKHLKFFLASSLKKPGYRFGLKLHVMRLITIRTENIVLSFVKTKVNKSSMAQNAFI